MSATTERRTLTEFISDHNISMDCEKTGSNPNMDSMPEGSCHYRCTFFAGERMRGPFEVPFSRGPALEGEPTAEDVLDCLASDASGVENARNFEEWASEYGYDTDSRKAERTYNIVREQAKQLRGFLGSDAYELLLWHTERE